MSRLLARTVEINPAGFAILNHQEILATEDEIGLRALGRVLVAVGATDYAPRLEKLERCYGELQGAVSGNTRYSGRTLGGCRLMTGTGRTSGKLLVCREARGLPEPMAVDAGGRYVWDRRFHIHIRTTGFKESARPRLAALGEGGWLEIIAQRPEFRSPAIPAPARAALPAFFDEKGVLSVPHLGFRRPDKRPDKAGRDPDIAKIRFYPPNSLTKAGFFLRKEPDILSL
ncbi:MAG: hypothetical protein HN719_00765 [Alphaproteobacteria bacterium]|nr:hypothetical protein [Alphaproteobacteria bacterium]